MLGLITSAAYLKYIVHGLWTDGEKHISDKYVFKEGGIVTNLFRAWLELIAVIIVLVSLVCASGMPD
jgi:hypothetical protein